MMNTRVHDVRRLLGAVLACSLLGHGCGGEEPTTVVAPVQSDAVKAKFQEKMKEAQQSGLYGKSGAAPAKAATPPPESTK